MVDQSIQRRHDPDRSAEIRRFVDEGYPFSTLTRAQRSSPEHENLQKPGWLPTAIVVNILKPGDERRTAELHPDDALVVSDVTLESSTVQIEMPRSWKTSGWEPEGTHPIEVIDGQHRLWAFDKDTDTDLDFDLPVVAFYGLDVSWQAYLFWTVNIKPKKINASLAFDLYPLLREQDWLLAGEGVMVYRETRAQELTEALWGTPESPWYKRINMLGDTGVRAEKPVTQAAFVRSLTNTFVRAWKTSRGALGGLFGGAQLDYEGLKWPRAQQAAFLIACWRLLDDAVAETTADWADELRGLPDAPGSDVPDPAFASPYSLLASDQGVRPVLSVFNDMTYVMANDFQLRQWQVSEAGEDVTADNIGAALAELEQHPVYGFLKEMAVAVATYDWRNSRAPDLGEDERAKKLVFRGSGGYKELRKQLLDHIRTTSDGKVHEAADLVIGRIT